MPNHSVPPPGQGPTDPYNSQIDSVAFALERVQTLLLWIEEHRASYEAARLTDPATAERERGFLADAVEQARGYHRRLVELLLAGYSIDPTKRLPRDFNSRA